MWQSSYMAVSLRFGVEFGDALATLGLGEDAPETAVLLRELAREPGSRREERALALAQGLARIAADVEREVVRR